MQYITYGYMRISSKDQNQDRQLSELISLGVPEKNIFFDIASGKNFDRPEYQKLKGLLKQGDILIVKSIDRLGRNYSDIIQEWQFITKELKAHIRVIDLPLLDTTIKDRDLTGTFITDMVLQILSYVAEQERNNIKQRQKEGIALAKAQGKHLGRPKATYPTNFNDVYRQWKNKEISTQLAFELLGMKKSTFYKLVKEYEKTIY